ncbi:MAG TPA: FeoA family protein [Candidatus Cloacimonadota bacterium]|nr:FeoA family protein [Candidatus Cloacimonadota bacterium]
MLSNRNRNRLRRFGSRLFFTPRPCPCEKGECIPLKQLQEDQSAIITRNSNLATLERGLNQGMRITMFRNEPNEPNLVIAVGDARYVLDRRLAAMIMVRVL